MTNSFVPDDEREKAWWKEALRTFAEQVASLDIVETTQGLLPASSEGESYADFIVPRLLAATGVDETTVARVWPLLAGTDRALSPGRITR